jgi:hypothetical protein
MCRADALREAGRKKKKARSVGLVKKKWAKKSALMRWEKEFALLLY